MSTSLVFKHWLWLCAACFLVAMFPIWQVYRFGDFNDDVSYWALSSSLLQGLPYLDLARWDAPAGSQFQILYPLLLAPLIALFPHHPQVYRLLNVGLGLIVLVLLWKLWKPLSPGTRRLALLILALNPFWLYTSSTAMSECTCLLTLVLCLLRLQQLSSPAPLQAFLFGMAASLCYYARLVGLLVAPTIALTRLRNWRPASLFSCMLGILLGAGPHLLSIGWFVLASGSGKSGREHGSILLTNATYLPRVYGSTLLGAWPCPYWWLGGLALAAALWGLWRLPSQRGAFWWTCLYLALLANWGFFLPRYAIPVLPFLIVGLSECLRRLPWRGLRLLGVGLWFLLAALGAVSQHQPARTDPGPMLRQFDAQRPANSRTVSDWTVVAFHTGQPVAMLAPDAIFQKDCGWLYWLESERAGLIVLGPTYIHYPLADYFERRPHCYRKLYRDSKLAAFVFQPNVQQRRAIRLHYVARVAMEQQRLVCAERLFRASLARQPEESQTHSGLAYSLAHQGRIEEARQELKISLQLDPANQEAQVLLRSL